MVLLFCLALPEIARPACPDCGSGALGGPLDNRFISFDSPCQASGCSDPGQPQLLVNTANLNLYVRVTDLPFGGAPAALVLEHSYNSDDRRPGPLGNGWTFNLGDTLTQDADSSWVLRRGSGRIDRFGAAIDPSQFFAITPTNDVLSRAADGTFTLRNAQTGTVRVFSKEGRLTAILDGGITRVALDYDAAGRLRAARPRGSNSRAIQFSYTGDGRISAITDAAGRTIQFEYDEQGNLVQQTNPSGAAFAYGYDENGRLISVASQAGQVSVTYSGSPDASGVSAISLPDGSSRQYAPQGSRQVQVTDGAGNITTYSSTVLGQTTAITDGAGNVTAYVYDAAGRRTSTTNANGAVTRFDYDNLGNLTAVTDPAQNRWTAAYSGTLLRQLTDANGKVFRFDYDTAGRLSAFTDPAAYDSPNTVTRTAAGLVDTLTDANGNVSSFQYDGDGLLTRWIDALGGTWSYQYDGALRVASRTEPGGSTLRASYDERNRLQAVTSGSSTLAFDSSGLQRDALNRLTGSADSFGNQVSYSYDAAGRLAAITLPGGNTVAYQYDAAGRLAKVSDWLGDFAIYKYDTTGLVSGITIGAGPVTGYQYDTASNLRALISTAADGTVVAGYRFTVDGNGNRLSAAAMEPSTAAINVNSATLAYNSANRLTAAGGQSYRYDASGRLIGIDGPGATTFSYDAFARLATAGSTAYAYDPLGLRVERNSGGDVRRFVYDLSGARPRVIMETDGGNNPVAYYVWGLGLLWKVTSAGQIYFYHFDADGNVVALSNASGIVNRYRYDPLGKLIASDEAVENTFRARGEMGWVDDGNGLLYADGNYYAPDLRRNLPGTVTLDPPNPSLVPRLTGAGACFVDGVSECAPAAGRRVR